MLFGEEMPWKRLAGIGVAMVGIVWYSILKLQESSQQLLPTNANGKERHHGWCLSAYCFCC